METKTKLVTRQIICCPKCGHIHARDAKCVTDNNKNNTNMDETQAAFDRMDAKEKAEFMTANIAWAAEQDLKNELKTREEL